MWDWILIEFKEWSQRKSVRLYVLNILFHRQPHRSPLLREAAMKAMPMPQALRDRILSVVQRAEAEAEAAGELLASTASALYATIQNGGGGKTNSTTAGNKGADSVWSAYKSKLAEARKREKRFFAGPAHTQTPSQQRLHSSSPSSPSSPKSVPVQVCPILARSNSTRD